MLQLQQPAVLTLLLMRIARMHNFTMVAGLYIHMKKLLLLGVAGAVLAVLALQQLEGGRNGERLDFPVTAEDEGSGTTTTDNKTERLDFPVTAEEALSIVMSNPEAKEFISEYLRNESRRITRVSLNYEVSTKTYVWKIELVERECGCKVGSEEGLNMLSAEVDPVTGKVLSLKTQVGVKEEEIARSRCMEGCHTANTTGTIVLQEEEK